MSEAACDAALHPPTGSTALIVASLVVIFVPALLIFFIDNRRVERRLYWSGCIGGGALMALALLYRGWVVSAITMAAFIVGAMMIAVRFTPYLKIGGRIIALAAYNRRPDPPDGDVPGDGPSR